MAKSSVDPAIIAELKARHGELFSITKAGVEVIYRACKIEELDRFISLAEQDKTQACVQLVASCVVHPPIEQFEELRRRKPGILYGDKGLVTEIQAASGMAEKAESVKL